MFDFSLGKLLIVAVIALIVLGPDKLPGAARTVGAMIRRLRASWDNVRADVEREFEIEEIRRAARQAAADAEAAQAEASSTLKQLNAQLDKVRGAKLQLDTPDDHGAPDTRHSRLEHTTAASTDAANAADTTDTAEAGPARREAGDAR